MYYFLNESEEIGLFLLLFFGIFNHVYFKPDNYVIC
jgi:hypothetical protein